MQLRDFVVSARKTLSSLYPESEAAAVVDILCRECFRTDSCTHIIFPSLELESSSLARAESMLLRLAAAEPLQYVLGYADFYGRRFKLSPSVLIPRPETELLCRDAIEFLSRRKAGLHASGITPQPAHKLRVLDLCTGSGCIAWTIALEVPGVEVIAVDISPDALAVASGQPFSNSPSPRFVCADIFDDNALSVVLGTERFDLVVSNPPYVLESEKSLMRRNVLDFEPSLALFVPDAESMAFNKKIAEICNKFLYTDAVGFVEINERLGADAKRIFEENGWKKATVKKDFSGRDRFVEFRMQ